MERQGVGGLGKEEEAMDFQVGKYYVLGQADKYLDGPCETYLGALRVWFFYYPRSVKIKQWTASGWKADFARWEEGAWQDK